jgi:hypothetical protein
MWVSFISVPEALGSVVDPKLLFFFFPGSGAGSYFDLKGIVQRKLTGVKNKLKGLSFGDGVLGIF